ncbi:MAG: hypothetical protein ACLU4N_04435 [Butyricimonas faecihominis]
MLSSWQVYGLLVPRVSEQRLIDHQYKDADADSRLADVFLNQYNMIAHANTILNT